MKKILTLSFIISCIIFYTFLSLKSWALPACPSDHELGWHNCCASYDWENGNKYVGEWKDGIMVGKGIYTFADGSKYKGEFKENDFNGQGKLIYENGLVVGEFRDGMLNGFAIQYDSNGIILKEGIWKDGEFQYAQKQLSSNNNSNFKVDNCTNENGKVENSSNENDKVENSSNENGEVENSSNENDKVVFEIIDAREVFEEEQIMKKNDFGEVTKTYWEASFGCYYTIKVTNNTKFATKIRDYTLKSAFIDYPFKGDLYKGSKDILKPGQSIISERVNFLYVLEGLTTIKKFDQQVTEKQKLEFLNKFGCKSPLSSGLYIYRFDILDNRHAPVTFPTSAGIAKKDAKNYVIGSSKGIYPLRFSTKIQWENSE